MLYNSSECTSISVWMYQKPLCEYTSILYVNIPEWVCADIPAVLCRNVPAPSVWIRQHSLWIYPQSLCEYTSSPCVNNIPVEVCECKSSLEVNGLFFWENEPAALCEFTIGICVNVPVASVWIYKQYCVNIPPIAVWIYHQSVCEYTSNILWKYTSTLCVNTPALSV